jgi:hypothetical protein
LARACQEIFSGEGVIASDHFFYALSKLIVSSIRAGETFLGHSGSRLARCFISPKRIRTNKDWYGVSAGFTTELDFVHRRGGGSLTSSDDIGYFIIIDT